jgi:CelD/BcsL family acetyltransferase involved in cellulose biosynthesis
MIQLKVVTNVSGFDGLEEAWLELQESCVGASIFLTWDWQRLWWKHYGQRRELRILIARTADRIVGILPLYIDRHRKAGGLFAARKLRQIGVGGDTSPDDLGALFSPDHEHDASAAMAEYLLKVMTDWDMLDWTDLPPQCPLVPALQKHFAESNIRANCAFMAPITFGELPDDWESYRRNLSRNRRETMRRKRRKFESQPGAQVVTVEVADELDGAFDCLAELHRLRWTGRTETPGFTSAQYRGFHRDIMHALLPQGRLRLMKLNMGAGTIAMLYCMRYRDTFYFFQSGFDPAYAEYSPGDVLLGYAIEHAIAEGCRIFDMLKGDHDYKRHFFQQDRRNLEMRAFRPGLIELAYRAKDAWSAWTSAGRMSDAREPLPANGKAANEAIEPHS